MNQQNKIEHIFRHEYGRLVALLLKRVGSEYLDAIEDSVQKAMMQALELWRLGNKPKSPVAWLYKVAYHTLLTELRANKLHGVILAEQARLLENQHKSNSELDIAFSKEMTDSMLSVLFISCNNAIPTESQLVFTLKSLCGFNIKEIALRLFISEANAYKRFTRAKHYLKGQAITFDALTSNEIKIRLASVHQVLYLIFTEGYLSSHTELAIRADLCHEAIRLTQLLCDSEWGEVPESYALLALMYFHLARVNARQNESGSLILLDQQERNKWDKECISIALHYLAKSASGDSISRYHIEAGIAAEHCLSDSVETTNWKSICFSYQLLEQVAPSPIHQLNYALAIAQWQGPKAGLEVLQLAEPPNWLHRNYYWYTVQADLHFRSGNKQQGRDLAKLAITGAPNIHIKQLITTRLLKRYA